MSLRLEARNLASEPNARRTNDAASSAVPILPAPQWLAPAPQSAMTAQPQNAQPAPTTNLPANIQVISLSPTLEQKHPCIPDPGWLAWSLLDEIPILKLRKMAFVWRVKQRGVKKDLMARMFIYAAMRAAKNDKTIEDTLAENPKAPKGDELQHYLRRACGAWKNITVPSESELRALADEDIREEPPQALSLSEFARLIVLLRDERDARDALLRAAEVISQGLTGATENVNSFWKQIVEPKFNDHNYRPHANVGKLSGHEHGIHSSKPPLRIRTGLFLRKQFLLACRSFHLCLENWMKTTGNSNGKESDDFICRDEEDGDFTDEGKRNIILFNILKCCSTHEEKALLRASQVLVHEAEKCADIEDRADSESRWRERVIDAEEPKKKRKDKSSCDQKSREDRVAKKPRRPSTAVEEDAESQTSLGEALDSRKHKPHDLDVLPKDINETLSKSDREKLDFERRMRRLQESNLVLASLDQTQRILHGSIGTSEYLGLVQQHNEKLMQRFKDFL